jgi:murein tripeptide amidase MpaA
MKKKESIMRRGIIILLGVCFLLTLSFSSVQKKTKKVTALGQYDFYHYYEYDELTQFLKDMQNAYPKLAELRSLCKSDMGRDVWMFVINNPDTGAEKNKPGFFLNQIHSSEVIAAMSCCYTIWDLLANYGKRDEITEAVDNLVWYIVPRLDMDGAEAYLTGKPAGEDPDPRDDDGDFVFDEDPPEDIDGDGFIVQMRQKDPEGLWKISEDDRRIMKRKSPDETGGTYYKLYSEGLDNDGDEKINEDNFRMRFLSNRNYPGNWKPDNVQRGAGRYPMEESITRAEVDFAAAHPNIAIYVQHHCCGRVILRPPTTRPDKDVKHQRDLELYKVVSARCLEHSGWDLATSVYDWNWPFGTPNRKATQIFRDKGGNIKNAPRGMYPEEEVGETLYDFAGQQVGCKSERGYYAWGSSIETMYDLLGIFSMGDEHWASPDYDKDGRVTEKERLKWNDEELDGMLYIDWHKFDHPTLGEVEIGGWKRRKTSPPEGELIQKECEMGNNFVIYLAGQVPRVKISETTITDKKGNVYQIDIRVKNTGFLPTGLQQAVELNMVDPVLLEIRPNQNVEVLLGEEKVKLGQIDGYAESEKTTYIVRVKDPSQKAVLRITVDTQKAGQNSKEIVIQ